MYEVTIAVPVYKVEKYIERSILSALNQTFKSIEFLIIDDKGGDASIGIVESIRDSHSRGGDIRIIYHAENIGTGGTKNTAIDEAKGKFLYFMDSDDRIAPDCIEKLYKYASTGNYDFVSGSYKRFNSVDEITEGCTYINTELKTNKELIEYKFIKKEPLAFATWNKLYTLAFLKSNNVRCIPHHLCEDQIFTFQVLLNATKVLLLADTTYYYFENEGSIMSKINSRKVDYRSATEYAEIKEFKLNYILTNSEHLNLLPILIAESIYFAISVNESAVLGLKEKNQIVIRLLDFNQCKIELADVAKISLKLFLFKILLSSPFGMKKFILNVISKFIKISGR